MMIKERGLPPQDLAAITMDVKNMLDRVSGSLHAIAVEPGLIFGQPNGTLLHMYLAKTQLEVAMQIVRGAWFADALAQPTTSPSQLG
jgi:hypothetical protein